MNHPFREIGLCTLLMGAATTGLVHAASSALKVPPAITTMCATPPNSVLVCEDLQLFLDAFNAESRENGWAKDMEARIRKAMRVGGKELREIRTLQCRSSRCALVYAVAAKDAEREVDGDLTLDQLMDLRTGAAGTEGPDESTVVGMLVWQTREYPADTARPGSRARE
jgi:hypothetical protein